LTPLGGDDTSRVHHWKYGFDLEVMQEAPSIFDPEPGEPEDPPAGLALIDRHRVQTKVLPTLLYDDVDVNNVEYDGLRTKLKAGPQLVDGQAHAVTELETYYYKMLPGHLNLGIRGVIGQSTFNSLQGEYFLGGLDTIRGLPDGAIYGTHAGYANVELRHLSFKMKYLWLQSAVFCDGGGAAATWHDALSDGRATAGVGIRLAVPQVYRMIFRIDYGWSIAGPRTQGITAGMNQFFDPYIPL
jgi:outer membrane protein assembly factor BamA